MCHLSVAVFFVFLWLNLITVDCRTPPFNNSLTIRGLSRARLPFNNIATPSSTAPGSRENVKVISAYVAPTEAPAHRENAETSELTVILANISSTPDSSSSAEGSVAINNSSIAGNSTFAQTEKQFSNKSELKTGSELQLRNRFPLFLSKRPPLPTVRLQHTTKRPSIAIKNRNITLITIVKRQVAPAWISSLEDFTIDVTGYL